MPIGPYCVYCDKSFSSFTLLRNHKCSSATTPTFSISCSSSHRFSDRFLFFNQSCFPSDSELSSLCYSSDSPVMEEENYKSTEYKYAIEMNEEIDSDIKNMTGDQVQKMVEKQNAKNLILEKKALIEKPLELSKNAPHIENGENNVETKSSDYVYVLETANMTNGKTTNDEDIDNGDGDDTEPKLVIDMSKGSNNDDFSGTNESFKERKSPSVEPLIRGDSPVNLTGANKRKRKVNMDNVLSSILKTKSHCEIGIDAAITNGLNGFRNVEDERPNKLHITDKIVESSPINRYSPIEDRARSDTPVNLSMTSDSVLDLSRDSFKTEDSNSKPINFTTSTPVTTSCGRKNRRKTSVPIKCEKIESNNINEYVEEYNKGIAGGRTQVADSMPMDLTPKSNTKKELDLCVKNGRVYEPMTNGPMDLSARNSPVNAVKKEKDESQSFIKKENNGPVDLSARNSPISVPHTLSNYSALNGILNGSTDSKVPGFSSPMIGKQSIHPALMPNPFLTGANPAQMKDFLDLMSKMHPNFPTQNTVQANAQLLQFNALMQTAMLNNSMMAMNKNGGQFKNDKNDNIVKSEPVVKTETNQDAMMKNMHEFNLELLRKNGLLTNGFMSGMNGFSPTMPFLPSQALLTPKGTPGRRRRSKDPIAGYNGPLLERTSIPKLEDIPLLRTHVDSANPDEIVETLKKLFPQQPWKSPTSETEVNAIRFFVKDNEQIQTIVDSLLVVCEIGETELELLGGEQGYRNVCRLCNATFFHMEHLTKHIKKIHVVKRFQCSECDRSFHDAGNYRQHMRVHDENDIPYECPECKRRFRHKCTLKVHLRIHTGEKPFKCEICSATFKISSGLQTHMRKHTGETPYACEYCSMRFKCQSNLKQHLFQHTQVRPFSCEICGKSYSRKSIRDAHMMTHSKEFTKFNLSQIPGLSPMTDLPLVESPEMPTLSSPEGPSSPQAPESLDVPVLNKQSVLAGQ